MNPKLLDNLARAIEAPRRQNRMKDIREAFAALTINVPWWVRMWRKIRG